MEIWALINENYQISNLGNIRNKNTLKILKPWRSGDGYQKISVGLGRERYYVHRLVAEAFCGKPNDNYLVVHHIDGNRANNNAKNLLWCSHKENSKFASLGNPPLHKLIEMNS